jgi:DNA-binding transcriptional MerR regulator
VTARRPAKGLRIGEVEARTGLTRDTIHFYVREGLVRPPEKSGATVAWYDPGQVAKLKAIRALRASGVPLAAVRRLLDDPSVAALPLASLEALGRELFAVGLREAPRAAVHHERSRALAARMRLADRLDESPALCDALSALCDALDPASSEALVETVTPALRALARAVVAGAGEGPDAEALRLDAASSALASGLGAVAAATLVEALTARATARRKR